MVIGGILSALPSGESLAYQLAACRVFVGLGAGGLYPITAIIARESCRDVSPSIQICVNTSYLMLCTRPQADGNAMVAAVHGSGAIGLTFGPLFLLLMLHIPGLPYDTIWRLMV